MSYIPFYESGIKKEEVNPEEKKNNEEPVTESNKATATAPNGADAPPAVSTPAESPQAAEKPAERDEEWYNSLLPEYKWMADNFGLKSQKDASGMNGRFYYQMANLYEKMSHIKDNPDYQDFSLAAAGSNGYMDSDIYDSITNKGYQDKKFSDLSPEQWREVYDDYLTGYNNFTKDNPYIPYERRWWPEYRKKWDTTYEGYEPSDKAASKEEPERKEVQSAKPADNSSEFTIPEEDLDKWRFGKPSNKPFPTQKVKGGEAEKGYNEGNQNDDHNGGKPTDLKEVTITAKRPEKNEETAKPANIPVQSVRVDNQTAPDSSPSPNLQQQGSRTHKDLQEKLNAIGEQEEHKRMQERQESEKNRTDNYIESTNKAIEEAGRGSSSNVKPLDVKPFTPAISGDPNETDEQKQARAEQRKLEYYAQEHPWVLEKDYSTMRDKYRDKKWSQIVNEVADYRRRVGKPMSLEEQMYMLSQYNPNTSKKEEVREKRRAYWADVINELGNVLAHFYNYGRAKAGSPAATITPNKSDNVARLRAADMAMRQRGYNDYVNAMANAEKRKQGREDEMRKLVEQQRVEQMRHNNQMELEKLKWMSPEYKKKIEAADIDIRNKAVQNEILELEKAFKVLRNETARNNAVDFFIKKNKGSGGSKTSANKTTGKYTFGDKSFNDPWQAYQYALSKGAKPAKRKKIDYVDGTEKEVDVTSKDFKNNDYSKWLDAVGVKTN